MAEELDPVKNDDFWTKTLGLTTSERADAILACNVILTLFLLSGAIYAAYKSLFVPQSVGKMLAALILAIIGGVIWGLKFADYNCTKKRNTQMIPCKEYDNKGTGCQADVKNERDKLDCAYRLGTTQSGVKCPLSGYGCCSETPYTIVPAGQYVNSSKLGLDGNPAFSTGRACLNSQDGPVQVIVRGCYTKGAQVGNDHGNSIKDVTKATEDPILWDQGSTLSDKVKNRIVDDDELPPNLYTENLNSDSYYASAGENVRQSSKGIIPYLNTDTSDPSKYGFVSDISNNTGYLPEDILHVSSKDVKDYEKDETTQEVLNRGTNYFGSRLKDPSKRDIFPIIGNPRHPTTPSEVTEWEIDRSSEGTTGRVATYGVSTPSGLGMFDCSNIIGQDCQDLLRSRRPGCYPNASCDNPPCKWTDDQPNSSEQCPDPLVSS